MHSEVGTGGGSRTRMPLRAWRFERHVNASSTTPAAVIRDSYYHSPAAADAWRAGLRDEKRRGDDPLPRAQDSNRFRLGAPQRPTGFGPAFDLTLIVPRTWGDPQDRVLRPLEKR